MRTNHFVQKFMVTCRKIQVALYGHISLVSTEIHSINSASLKPSQIPVVLSRLQSVYEKHAAVAKAKET